MQVIVPDTLSGPGVVSPLIEQILQLDPDITITPVQRSAFSDAAGIQCIKKLAVMDHQSVLHVVEQKYVLKFQLSCDNTFKFYVGIMLWLLQVL